MKKRYRIFIIGLLTLGLFSSCDDDFGDINTHPERPTITVPDYLFTNLMRKIGYQGGQNLYLYNPQTLPVTRLATTTPVSDMSKLENQSGVDASWTEYYLNLDDLNKLRELISGSLSDPERHRNQLAMLDIYDAYFAFRVLDKFGDIPYSNAGQGLSGGIFRSEYESQGAVYDLLLTKLAAAVASIQETAETPSGETYFDFDANAKLFPGGNAIEHFTNWKKFANSLILKYALRFSKFNQSGAQSYIQTALQGPLMSSIADGAQIVPFDLEGFGNGSRKNAWAWARYYDPSSQPSQFLATKLSNAADESNVDPTTDDIFDPRFYGVYFPNMNGEYLILPDSPDAVAATGANFNQGDLYLTGENGKDIIADHTDPDYGGSHAMWNRMYTMSVFQAQKMLTYQEHLLIIAEIYTSGLASGDANAAYTEGVTVAVEEFFNPTYAHYADRNPTRVITPTAGDISDLLAEIALSGDQATALEQIRTQRWIDYMFQPDQAWAMIRRTNWHNLEVTVPITNNAVPVTGINRVNYPANEADYNTENYNAQLSKMGGLDDVSYKADIFK